MHKRQHAQQPRRVPQKQYRLVLEKKRTCSSTLAPALPPPPSTLNHVTLLCSPGSRRLYGDTMAAMYGSSLLHSDRTWQQQQQQQQQQ